MKIFKKTLALILALIIVFGMVPTTIFAQDESNVTNGYYVFDEGANATWQSGTNTSKDFPQGIVSLNKTATPVEGETNLYNITLTVDTTKYIYPSAIALCIDTSSSMVEPINDTVLGYYKYGKNEDYSGLDTSKPDGYYCFESSLYSGSLRYNATTGKWEAHCEDLFTNGWTQLEGSKLDANFYISRKGAMIDAMYSFMSSYKSIAPDGLVTIVTFGKLPGENYDGAQVLLDWTTDSDAVLSAIMNMDAGDSTSGYGTPMTNGINVMSSQLDSDLLTLIDQNNKFAVIFGDGDPDDDDTAISAAAELKSSTKINKLFAVYSGDESSEVMDEIATSSAYSMSVLNQSALNTAFSSIFSTISGTVDSNLTVTDPMADYISVVSAPSEFVAIGNNTYTWDLADTAPTNDGKTYSLTYTIRINADYDSFDEDAYYPANKPTYLSYKDGTYYFPVPGVKGEKTKYTVTFVNWDDSVISTAEYKYGTSASDVVVPEATRQGDYQYSYFFKSWDKTIVDVTDNATYKATYDFVERDIKYTENSDGTITLSDGSAFEGSDLLVESTYVDKNVTIIGNSAFSQCNKQYIENQGYSATSLQTVTINEGITEIQSLAFYNNDGLTTVNLPVSLTKIGSYAFENCDSLTLINYSGTKAQWNDVDRGDDWIRWSRNCTVMCADGQADNIFEFYLNSNGTYILDAGWFFDGEDLVVPSVYKDIVVTEIDFQAFYGCNCKYNEIDGYTATSLKTVTIPEGITVINHEAFCNNEGLTTISLPQSLVRIETRAFQGCTSLTTINYAGTVEQWTSIVKEENWDRSTGNYVILCTDGQAEREFSYTENSDETLTLSDGSFYAGSDLVVEATYGDKNVTIIGNNAFSLCNSQYIEYQGYVASSLQTVTINEGITEIQSNAFNYNSGLTTVNLPISLTKIGSYAFSYCYHLTTINYAGTVEQWNNIEKDGIWSQNTGNFVINCIDGNAEREFTYGEYDDGTLVLLDGSFYAGSDLVVESTYEDKNVTVISSSAFSQCNYPYNATYGPVYATSLKTVKIAEGIHTICSCAFYCNTGLTIVELPSSITKIYDNAFMGCSSLSLIRYAGTEAQWELIDKGNNFTDSGVVIYCSDSNLNSEWNYTLLDDNTYSVSLIPNYYDEVLVIPETYQGIAITKVETSSFSSYESQNISIKKIQVPQNITSFDYKGLYYCVNLSEIQYNCTKEEFANMTHSSCYGDLLNNITFVCSDGIIDDELLYSEKDDQTNKLTYGLFSKAISLEIPSVYNNKTLTEIGANSFKGNYILQSVNIPEGVTTIGESAFESCNLTSVTLPSTLIKINESAFSGCSQLSEVIFNGTKAQWDAIEKGSNCNSTAKYNLICSDYAEYLHVTLDGLNYELNDDHSGYILKSADNILSNTIVIPDEIYNLPVVEIKNYVFANNTILESIYKIFNNKCNIFNYNE